MKQRCTNPNHRAWNYYGGQGITVCERWLNFENFFADMGDRPEAMSIDRIDPSGVYEPSNCRWADAETQAANTCRGIEWRFRKHAAAQIGVPVARWQEFVLISGALSELCRAQDWHLTNWRALDENEEHLYNQIKIERLGDVDLQFPREKNTINAYRTAYESVLKTIQAGVLP